MLKTSKTSKSAANLQSLVEMWTRNTTSWAISYVIGYGPYLKKRHLNIIFQKRKRNKNRVQKRVQPDHSAVRDVAIPPKTKNNGIRRPLQPNRQLQQPSASIRTIDLTIDSRESEPPSQSTISSTSKVPTKRKSKTTARKIKNPAPYSK